MKKLILFFVFVSSFFPAQAQSKTTNALQARFEQSLSLYFYKNTLRMLNQQDSKEFDELIKNVEKLKFLMVEKKSKNFGPQDYEKLTSDYKKESYEPIVTSRFEGKNLDIFLKDTKGSTPGTVVLVNDSTSLFVLDMIGTIEVSKAGALFSAIDGSTDIGKKIRNFTNHEPDSIKARKKKHRIK